jgi:hypothetical protein
MLGRLFKYAEFILVYGVDFAIKKALGTSVHQTTPSPI